MKKPLVAIVGKPNVGKSTFFNKIAGSKISIVEDIPGVTRDRIFANAEWCGYQFQIVDTGGLDFGKDDEINKRLLFEGWTVIRFWGDDIKKYTVECVRVVEETIFDMFTYENE